jgi:hypothetical protein
LFLSCLNLRILKSPPIKIGCGLSLARLTNYLRKAALCSS